MIFKPTGRKFTFECQLGIVNRTEVGEIALETDELLTFTTDSGTEFDLIREDFGHYVTQSHHRLLRYNLRPV